jgi:hypothetical protein
MKRLNYSWELPQSIVERLGSNTYGSQRNIFEESHLLIILHEIPSENTHERQHKVFLVKPDQEIWCNGMSNGKFELNQLLANYKSAFEVLEEGIDLAKESKDFFTLLEELVPINRAIKNLSKTLKESRKICQQNSFILEMRDWADDLLRSYEMLLADTKLALEFRIAQNTEEQVQKSTDALRAQNKLNILAAFTFPIMSVATIFGMNLQHGLETRPNYIFWGVLSSGVLVGLLVKRWLFTKKN